MQTINDSPHFPFLIRIDSRSARFSYIKDTYRILEFSAAVNVAIGEPNLEFLLATVKQLMEGIMNLGSRGQTTRYGKIKKQATPIHLATRN